MSTMETVEFNGVCLTDLYTVIGVHRPMPGVSNETQEIGGRDGVMIVGSHIPSTSITMRIIIKDKPALERREDIRRLSSILHTDEPKKLMFASDNGRYYMAKLDGEPENQEYIGADVVSVSFMVENNVLYGKTRSVTVPSGGSVTFSVEGTYETMPRIEGTVIGIGDSRLWGLRLDDGDVMRIPTGSMDGVAVSIDCDSRTARVSGALRLPTPESDWFTLSHGTHVMANDVGSGSCVVSWQEMWL